MRDYQPYSFPWLPEVLSSEEQEMDLEHTPLDFEARHQEQEKLIAQLMRANGELTLQNQAQENQLAELSASLERMSFLASIANNIQDIVIASDNDTRVTRWNHVAEELLEWTTEEAIGKPTIELLRTVYSHDSRSEIIDFMQTKGTWLGEITLHTKSGKPIYALATASYLKDFQGNATGHLFIARDITQRKKAEVEILKANERFATIFNFCPIALGITSISEGRFVDVNDVFCQTVGYTKHELIGRKAAEVQMIGQVTRDKIVNQILNDGGHATDIIETLRKPNGESIVVLFSVEKLEIDGKPCLAFALIDITQRIKAEEALSHLNVALEQRVNERTEAVSKALEDKNMILESIGDAYFAVDHHWKVTYWNNVAEAALRVQKQDILDKNLWDVFSNSIDLLSYQKYHEAMRTRQVVHFEDHYEALQRWYDISAYPSEAGLVVFFKDITERKKAVAEIRLLNEGLEKRVMERTEKLLNANKELEQFSYIASHDLQEPLRTVSNYMTVFQEDYADLLDGDGIGYLHAVNNAIQRMNVLIQSLLDYSKLGHNAMLSWVDSKSLVEVVLQDLEMMIRASGADIDVHEMPSLYLYETEMLQVFQNLIVNAIKFRKPDQAPQIRIRSQKMNDGWTFSVNDQGLGIKPIHFERIFDIFQRLHPHGIYEGNGIGLSNCKKIILSHQGKIWVESTPEEGTTFFFTIPLLTP